MDHVGPVYFPQQKSYAHNLLRALCENGISPLLRKTLSIRTIEGIMVIFLRLCPQSNIDFPSYAERGSFMWRRFLRPLLYSLQVQCGFHLLPFLLFLVLIPLLSRTNSKLTSVCNVAGGGRGFCNLRARPFWHQKLLFVWLVVMQTMHSVVWQTRVKNLYY